MNRGLARLPAAGNDVYGTSSHEPYHPLPVFPPSSLSPSPPRPCSAILRLCHLSSILSLEFPHPTPHFPQSYLRTFAFFCFKIMEPHRTHYTLIDQLYPVQSVYSLRLPFHRQSSMFRRANYFFIHSKSVFSSFLSASSKETRTCLAVVISKSPSRSAPFSHSIFFFSSLTRYHRYFF